ncbi:hypothetical protein RMN56_14295 [Micromonospora halotolerans]|uniref:Heparin binding hemagglutinin HbhA n=1 Tax=Micromonospora halotolerans TaxID=709879 RepID=A0ABZ0A709_9ACTN|nr:hypothetical protein [Micromonospora halotolerans]WNM42426.1 hypothetical protein RMN56_14295 [Micromonospora halotolerans]
MTPQPKTNRIPAPVYAAAGAGELALQQLRKLPTVVGDLGTRVVADLGGKAVITGFELRQKATETLRTANLTATGLREKAGSADLDLDKLREAANLDKLRETANLDKLREATNLDKLREAAGRNAAAVLAGAQAAQERALAAYAELVARGERVVGAGVLEAADTVNADIEATGAVTAPAAQPAEVPTPAEVAEVVEAKPAAVKRTRATKATAAKATTAKATPSAKLPKTTKRTRPAAE